MPLLNYTSNIDADKTAQEIARCLSMHGAKAVLTEYNEEDNTIKSISFMIPLNGKDIRFRLPCDWRPVYDVMRKEKNWDRYGTDKLSHLESELRIQSVKTAWRIVKDWVEAQMALVETLMVTTAQVFLPYAIMKNGQTLSEGVAENPQLLLGN